MTIIPGVDSKSTVEVETDTGEIANNAAIHAQFGEAERAIAVGEKYLWAKRKELPPDLAARRDRLIQMLQSF